MYYNYCCKSAAGKTTSDFRRKSSTRRYKRRIQRFIQKLKCLKAKQQIQEFQKFSIICFIGNSQSSVEDKQGLAELFKAFVNLANKSFHEFINWIMTIFPAVTGAVVSFFKNKPSYIIFGVALSVALIIFRTSLTNTGDKILNWFISAYKQNQVGCSSIILLAIYCLLMLVTDLPRIPIKALILYIIRFLNDLSKQVSSWFQSLKNTTELSTELTNELKPNNNANSERNTMVTLFIITVVVLRYAVTVYKSQVFEKIPFGDVLIEIFKYDESEHSKQLIPG